MLNFPRCLQPSGKCCIELDVHGAVFLQCELGGTRAHSQSAEPSHVTTGMSQCVDDRLKKRIGVHCRYQPRLNLYAQLQSERPPCQDNNTTEATTSHDFGKKGVPNRAGCSEDNRSSTDHMLSGLNK